MYKNVVLLKEEQFKKLGNRKILMNTSIGTASDRDELKKWLSCADNLFCCHTEGALGDPELLGRNNVIFMGVSVGRTRQAFELLSKKVLDNIKNFLGKEV